MENTYKTQKIRFKFASGEEFEAEGTLDFVEKQRDYFLELVKKKPLATLSHQGPYLREDISVSGPLTPATPTTQEAYLSPQHPGVDNQRPAFSVGDDPLSSTQRLWEQLLIQEGNLLYLRRKLHLSADEAALIILAGGKKILSQEGCSALHLARSLEKSGFKTGRLDRLLAISSQLGFIEARGSRRGRFYAITPTGFAHAFVLARKKAQGNR